MVPKASVKDAALNFGFPVRSNPSRQRDAINEDAVIVYDGQPVGKYGCEVGDHRPVEILVAGKWTRDDQADGPRYDPAGQRSSGRLVRVVMVCSDGRDRRCCTRQ